MGARNEPSLIMRVQNRMRSARAPSRPPWTRPQASSTALTAPALAPLMVSKSKVSCSSRRSRTPQVKAENEPPPCRARDSRRGGQWGCGEARPATSEAVRSAARLVSVRMDLVSVGGSACVRTSAVASGFCTDVSVAASTPLDQMSAAESNRMPVDRAATCEAVPLASKTSCATDGGVPVILGNHVATTHVAGCQPPM